MLVRKFFAIAWLLIISTLFFLPGSALPKENLLGIPDFDKYVHTGFFAVLLFLWRFFFPDALRFSFLLLVLAFLYGLSVEVIQHYIVAHRSFDWKDLVADMAGAVIGIASWWVYKKNRPL